MELSGVQARAAALAADQKSIADRVGAIDAQAHAVADQALAAQAQAAARALLNSGVQGANAAAALANSSQDVDVLTAAYYRLMTAQAAGTATGAAGGAGAGPGAGASAAASATAAAKARQDQILATGTHAQKLAVLTAIYREQVKLFGPDSAQAISAQTRLMQERNNAAKSHTKELGTQLNLEERIADSKKAAALGDRCAPGDQRRCQAGHLDADRLRRNQITASRATDPRIRALAALDSERVPLEDARRALDIREQSATVRRTARERQDYPGRPRRALPALPGGAVGLPALPGLPAGVGGGVPIVHVYLDSQEITARVVVQLSDGAQQAISAGAGR